MIAAGVVAFVIGELVLVHHGGSCSNGAVAVPSNPCTETTYRAGGLIGGGIVAVVLASIVISFTLGPTIVWGVIGVAFLAIGLSGLRSDRRAAADDQVELLG